MAIIQCYTDFLANHLDPSQREGKLQIVKATRTTKETKLLFIKMLPNISEVEWISYK